MGLYYRTGTLNGRSLGLSFLNGKYCNAYYNGKKVWNNMYHTSWNDITYGNGKFVAVGNYKIAISNDGINWKLMFFDNTFNNVYYGNGTFLTGDIDLIFSSSNGVDWNGQYLPHGYHESVVAGNGKYIIFDRAGTSPSLYTGKILYSTDLLNWTTVLNHTTRADFNNAIYANGIFIFLAQDGLYYSNDGINWNINNTLAGFSGISYGNGKFVAVHSGAYNNNYAYSEDGITWNFYTYREYASECIAYGNGYFVSAGTYNYQNNNIRICYSSDGINWNKVNTNIDHQFSVRRIAYGNGKFVIIGWNKTLLYSTDIINWTRI
jgi:hypothetical protein